MRGATGVTIQPPQILHLPRKMTLQDVKENLQKQVKRHFQCGADPTMIRPWSENDPSMIREWSENENANRNPPRKWGYFARSPEAFSIVKYNVLHPILHSNFHQILRLPRKVPLERHQILRLPRKVPLERHQVLRLPRKVTLELHQVLRLPRKVTLELHQVLHLPRKVTLELHQVLHLPRKVTLELHQVLRLPLYCNWTLLYSTLLDSTLLDSTLLDLLYLILLYLTYSTWLYSTWHYSTWLYSTWLYSTWHYSTWLYSTWLYSTWHYSTWLYSTWLYSTWPTLLDSTLLDSTLLDSTLLDTILLDSTLLDTILLDSTLLDTILLDSTLLDSTLLDLLYLTLLYLTLFYLTLLYLTLLYLTLLYLTLLYLTLLYLTLLYWDVVRISEVSQPKLPLTSDFTTAWWRQHGRKDWVFAHLKPGVLCIREASKEEVGTVVGLVVQVFSESNNKCFPRYMVWEARHHGTPQFLEGFPYSKGLISGWFDKKLLRICQELLAQNKLETYLDVFSTCFFLPWFSPRMFRSTQKQSKHIYTKHYQTKPKSCTIFTSSMGILSKSCALQLKLQLYDWHMNLKNYLTVSSKWWKFDRRAFCGAANRFQWFLCPDFAWGQHSAEQAAKELQEAMNSGDAQILMNAIDNAKLRKVNQEAGNSDAKSDRNAADRYF